MSPWKRSVLTITQINICRQRNQEQDGWRVWSSQHKKEAVKKQFAAEKRRSCNWIAITQNRRNYSDDKKCSVCEGPYDSWSRQKFCQQRWSILTWKLLRCKESDQNTWANGRWGIKPTSTGCSQDESEEQSAVWRSSLQTNWSRGSHPFVWK